MAKRPKKRVPVCLIEGCGNPAHRRGLCVNCHMIARRRIRDGKVSEQAMIDAGLILPSKQGQRTTLFSKALAKALSK